MLLRQIFLHFVQSKIFRFALVINVLLAVIIGLNSQPEQTYSSHVLLKILKNNNSNSSTLSILSGTTLGLSPEAAAYRATNKKSLYNLLYKEFDYFGLSFSTQPTAIHDSILEEFLDSHLNIAINNSSSEVEITFTHSNKDSLNLFMEQYCKFISDSVVNKEINALRNQLTYLNAENQNIQREIIDGTKNLSQIIDKSNSIQLQADITPIKLLEKEVNLKENQLNFISEQIALKKTEIALHNQQIFFNHVNNYNTKRIHYSVIKEIFEYFFYFTLTLVLIILLLFFLNDRS